MRQPLSNLDEPIINHIHPSWSSIRADDSVARTLDELRKRGIPEGISYFYALDQDDRLLGVVPTRRLLTAAPEAPIRSIMLERVVSLPSTAKVIDACDIFLLHKYLALPVVDANRKLLGVIDIGLFTETIVETVEKEEADDIFQLIGVRVAKGREGSPFAAFHNRFPWLLCNITGGLLCALIAGMYEEFMETRVILALFIPIVLALAESVSIQSMTITLQSLDIPGLGKKILVRALGKEFLIAAMLGIASGGAVGAITWIWKGEVAAALVIGGSILLSVITACLLGVVLPTVVNLMGRDPKIAAGPIVLALSDTATLLLYFTLAANLL